MLRLIALLAAMLTVSACASIGDLGKDRVALGDFSLGHRVVVAPNLTKGPASRDATKEEWEAAMVAAINERFGDYEGERLYHFGISVEGYVLAQPGIPLVLNPKSVIIFNLTVWDDAAGKKLNAEPEQITVFEAVSEKSILGSGLTQTKEEQIQALSRAAAKMIEKYLVRMNRQEKWFKSGAQAAAPKAAAPADAADEAAGADTVKAAAKDAPKAKTGAKASKAQPDPAPAVDTTATAVQTSVVLPDETIIEAEPKPFPKTE